MMPSLRSWSSLLARRALSLAALLAAAAGVDADEYPALPPPADVSSYGKHFQRSMTLLETSTPERRNTLRVLYYGQSIVGQRWSRQVDAALRERYPHADLVSRNLAIGGFGSQRLVRTMEYDVFPFYPDLIVFHVYGSHVDYETIIRTFRERTSAEIIIQTDHANRWPEPRAASLAEQKSWDGKMNHWFLPRFAATYGCALQPQRDEWAHYLRTRGLEPQALLTDSVHLNDHGKWLMAELLKRFMVYLPQESDDEWRDLATTYEVGKDVHWNGKRLRLEIDGNRVVALAGVGLAGKAQVRIDGRRPGEFPDCYAFTRPSGTAGVGWPALQRISREAPLVIEEWTATCRGFNDTQDDFEFTVDGSVTGPDGTGRGSERFVSKSGRIVIEPADWVFSYCKKVSKKPTPDGWKVRWRVVPLFTDTYAPAPVEDGAREHPVVLASNLPNGKHTLELIAVDDRRPPIRAIRVHRPPR